MPYLLKGHKEIVGQTNIPTTPGELNYLVTKLCLTFLDSLKDQQHLMIPKDVRTNSYSDYNAVIGALESCKLEFYRRAVSVYEDEKIKSNGDVY